jgi:hypothetical protein
MQERPMPHTTDTTFPCSIAWKQQHSDNEYLAARSCVLYAMHMRTDGPNRTPVHH